MIMSKVERGEKILNKLVGENRLTMSGKDWLITALDPFHDNQLDHLEGWPDVECGASVVRCVKKSFTVAVPPQYVAGSNWDMHLVVWPMLVTSMLIKSQQRAGQVLQGSPLGETPTQGLVGGVQAFAVGSGQDLDILQSVGSNTIKIGEATLDPSFTRGSGRLIGMGVEIHNTTAKLYLQGSLCCYRMMADCRDPSTFVEASVNGAATPYAMPFSATTLRYPPKNLAEALLISGSRQWTAEEGCYQTMAFTTQENPAIAISTNCAVISVPAADDLDGAINTSALYCPVPRQPLIAAPYAGVPAQRVHNIHQSGVILTGLSYTTTLTVNVNYYYESFPGPSQPEILVLAKPSCKYDPCAMEFYSRIIQELPVGVPVRENGLGDWFLDAASKAAKFIGPALMALNHPIAKGAGAALSYLGDTGQNYVKTYAGNIPANAWEMQSGMPKPALIEAEVRDIRKKAQKQQKKKDAKKIAKAVNRPGRKATR